MRLLVFGGRDFARYGFLFETLDQAVAGAELTCLIEGGADGADSLARMWARRWAVPCITHHADWQRHGRSAGMRRNALMLKLWEPPHAVGFKGGPGTAGMKTLLAARPEIKFWDRTED